MHDLRLRVEAGSKGLNAPWVKAAGIDAVDIYPRHPMLSERLLFNWKGTG